MCVGYEEGRDQEIEKIKQLDKRVKMEVNKREGTGTGKDLRREGKLGTAESKEMRGATRRI